MAAQLVDDTDAAMAVAAAIADGVPVDWTMLPSGAPEDTRAVVAELRLVEELSRLSAPVPRTWGPFAITGELGQGAFGTVYRASDPTLGIDVAVKIIRGGRAAALAEVKLLAQVTHPNVVRIFGAETVGDDVGVSMELLDGRTLHEVVTADGALPLAQVLAIGGDICAGVAAIHAAGLVHGDIKASNVMRTSGGRIVVMDLGAGYDTKAAGGGIDAADTGTPLYLAPEVRSGAPRSTASDVYSLGVLLFYLAAQSYPSGRRPGGAVQRLRDVRPDLAPAFAAVVDRALAVDPAQRFADASCVEAALRDAAAAMVTARRWRHAALGALTAAAAVALAFSFAARRQPPAGSAGSAAVAPAAALTPRPPASIAAPAYSIEAAFYRHRGDEAVRLAPGATVTPGDTVSLRFSTSTAANLVVVNEDEHGHAYVLYPLPGQRLKNPVAPDVQHELPGVVNGERQFWQVDSVGGREHFLVLATPGPLPPAMQEALASLPPARPDQPVLALPLPHDVGSMLRGVGGMTKAPPRRSLTLVSEFPVPLPTARETVSGTWARRLTVDNPGR